MAIIRTTLGDIDETLLEKRTGVLDNENEIVTWVEYWTDSVLVHRSVDLQLKQGIFGALEAASF